MPIIRVAINVPVDTLFDYLAPDACITDIGLRVKVPFGKKLITGVIIEIHPDTDVSPEKLKSAEIIFREIPPIAPTLLNLFRFCSDYYHHPLGMVVMNGLPSKFRGLKPIKQQKTSNCYQFNLTDSGRQIDLNSIPVRNRVKRRLFKLLLESNSICNSDVKQLSLRAPKVLNELLAQGLVEERLLPPTYTNLTEEPSIPILTNEQENAVNCITNEFNKFKPWLLHGITGSGKTEVYLRLIALALSQKKQTLILIPEINLTPQLEAIFRTRFPCEWLVSLHSGLNDTERINGWLQAQNGTARIILGTRLAVFTPLPHLGLVIVDEEQDNSFKQQDGLRYSARDIAIFRAKQINVPVVLGSATPSLESYYNAINHKYHSLRLVSRAIKQATLPTIHCIDTRTTKLKEGLSEALINALEQCIAQQQQSLVFINRRGYAPILLCKSCTWTANCQRCSSRLVVHLKEKKLCCHHCGHKEQLPRACPECGDQDIHPFGHGTQRVETALAERFPNARILRIDRDSIRRKDAWQNILKTIQAQEVDILVGTQLLAKGHDFPNLSLVGILNPDSALYSTDFRASERLFIQLMQVSGRAGRAGIAGNVLIQTEFPNHPLYQAIKQHDYDSLAHSLLEERKIAEFPPFVYQVLLRAQSHRIDIALDFLTKAAAIAAAPNKVEVFDPVPAQMSRLKGMERAHLLIQSRSRKLLQAFLTTWQPKLKTLSSRKVRWALDIDPTEI